MVNDGSFIAFMFLQRINVVHCLGAVHHHGKSILFRVYDS